MYAKKRIDGMQPMRLRSVRRSKRASALGVTANRLVCFVIPSVTENWLATAIVS